MAPLISTDRVINGERQFWSEINAILAGGASRICDVGGGAKPILSLDRIEELGLDYVVLDESEEELDRTPDGYQRFHASILDRAAVARLVEQGPFDAVLTRWTAEHVPDGKLFHEEVFTMLRPGGVALHYFPTLYSLPFLVNRLLTPAASESVLYRLFPSRKVKFRPYYSWCRGPTRGQLRRLEALGYSVERYTGYFGHGNYRQVKPLDAVQRALTNWLVEHPQPLLTSFALVVLRRPP
ncbi:MAG TPA: methyltransferase domain-containing protein [Solirubrobacteraceae bacterium]|nr:methyltransferase domain-containing protein [Solirubrobacteraceae bacterium]